MGGKSNEFASGGIWCDATGVWASRSSQSLNAYVLAKWDPSGAFLWQSLASSSINGLWGNGTDTFGTGSMGGNLTLLRWDDAGNLSWVKEWGVDVLPRGGKF